MRNCLTIVLLIYYSNSFAQVADNSFNLSSAPVNSFLEQTTARLRKLDEQTVNATEKILAKLQREEEKLAGKTRSKDSILHDQVFSSSAQFYQQLKEKLLRATDTSMAVELNEYIPYLDTLKTSLTFLSKQKFDSKELNEAQQILRQYQSRLQITNTIKQEIQQREQQLKEQLKNIGFVKELSGFNKEVYYYERQLIEYKEAFKDPRKLEQKAIRILSQTKMFKEFMQKNSMLSGLFRIPDPGDPVALADIPGMQTRNSVQQLLSQRFAALPTSGTAVNPQQYMQQQIQAVQPQLDAIKTKLNKLGGGNSDMEMADFKPDNQKTKSFFKRLEYGINIQSQRNTGLLPVTTDLALTVGYKLSDKTVVGTSIAYKLGWGQDISHIDFSNQGIGLRSYFDIQVKGGIWASGGFEYNYLQEFKKWPEINSIDVWQKSCLAGLTKKYKIGKRENKLQVLWDFLSYYQVPKAQPLKFRIGFNF